MNEITKLTDQNYSAKISSTGAQLLSFNDGTREVMWQANPDVWGFTAPVLFPVCGRLKNDEYSFNEKKYAMGNHGFARFKEFDVESKSENEVCFLLRADEDTMKSYPFDFEFRVTYTLNKNKLDIKYSVTNPAEENIYFSFGGHEGYACKDSAENYCIEFEKDTSLTRYMLTDGFFNCQTEEISLTDKKLMLDYDEFDKCTYMFRNINSDSVVLSKKDGTEKVRIGFESHPTLAIWTLRPRQYVCIEPWCGVSEAEDFCGSFNEKDGMIELAPKETFERTHYIEIL